MSDIVEDILEVSFDDSVGSLTPPKREVHRDPSTAASELKDDLTKLLQSKFHNHVNNIYVDDLYPKAWKEAQVLSDKIQLLEAAAKHADLIQLSFSYYVVHGIHSKGKTVRGINSQRFHHIIKDLQLPANHR